MKQATTSSSPKAIFIDKIVPSFLKGMSQMLTTAMVVGLVLLCLKLF